MGDYHKRMVAVQLIFSLLFLLALVSPATSQDLFTPNDKNLIAQNKSTLDGCLREQLSQCDVLLKLPFSEQTLAYLRSIRVTMSVAVRFQELDKQCSAGQGVAPDACKEAIALLRHLDGLIPPAELDQERIRLSTLMESQTAYTDYFMTYEGCKRNDLIACERMLRIIPSGALPEVKADALQLYANIVDRNSVQKGDPPPGWPGLLNFANLESRLMHVLRSLDPTTVASNIVIVFIVLLIGKKLLTLKALRPLDAKPSPRAPPAQIPARAAPSAALVKPAPISIVVKPTGPVIVTPTPVSPPPPALVAAPVAVRTAAPAPAPISPTQTERARDAMRIALSYLAEAEEAGKAGTQDKTDTLNTLSLGTKQLEEARKLDPNATLDVSDEEVQEILTQNGLRSRYLYCEAIVRMTDDPKRAIKIATQSADLKPDFAPVWYMIGVLNSVVHNKQAAIQAFEKAVHYAPTNIEYKKELDRARNMSGIAAVAYKVGSAKRTTVHYIERTWNIVMLGVSLIYFYQFFVLLTAKTKRESEAAVLTLIVLTAFSIGMGVVKAKLAAFKAWWGRFE